MVESAVHYSDVILSTMETQITGVSIVCSPVCSDQRKYQSSALLALCEGNSPVTGEFPSQKASNAENLSVWWRHHGQSYRRLLKTSEQVVMLQLEDIIILELVDVDLHAALARLESLLRLLLAVHERGATRVLGHTDARQSRLLLGGKEGIKS